MRRIGIMGGTFNPVHVGHLMLAEWVRDALKLDEVWFIPTGSSYMKDSRDILPGRERLHMVELAIQDNPFFRCLDLEIVREGRTYSYETLEQLRAGYPEDMFYFITGADCLFAIDSWKNPERIFSNCTLAAAGRGDVSLEEMGGKKRELEQKFQMREEIQVIPFLSLSVSSTLIRRRILQGQSIRYLVPDRVISYIEEKGFYREKNDVKEDQKSS
ncbi:MAG TPA: nicotinate-nucleotide adenylyltransferase [Lachnospiraceae bacterium]|nr:nicotinate-nucleotide adenylyltransferase [Lachnospiraceae bacterium]